MRNVRSMVLAVMAFWMAACGDDATGPIESLPRALTAAERQLVSSGNGFSFSLFRQVQAATNAGANIFVSPLSVATALGMTLNGAAGETEAAIRSALGLDGLARDDINRSFRDLIALLEGLDGRVEFAIANSIWAREGVVFDPQFLEVNRQYFAARVEALDFSAPGAAATINDWVDERTRGRIPTIVDDGLPPDLLLFVVNAIYFKGDWTRPFDAALTRGAPFALSSGDSVDVPTMTHGTAIEVRSGHSGGVQVLELPYARGAFSMLVLAPDDPAALDAVANALDPDAWEEWVSRLQDGEAMVYLPRFSFSFDVTLNDALDSLGMGLAFTGAADFTRVRPEGGLSISEVRHKAFVDVNEAGTEAAAATSTSIIDSGPAIIRIDRPFLFILRERLTGTVLFLGRVMDPR